MHNAATQLGRQMQTSRASGDERPSLNMAAVKSQSLGVAQHRLELSPERAGTDDGDQAPTSLPRSDLPNRVSVTCTSVPPSAGVSW